MTSSIIHNFPPPTSGADFERAMRRGLGRAVLWLQSGAVSPDRDLILRACREDWSFDSQIEDNRALYMADIVRATGDAEFYIAQVLDTLTEDMGRELPYDASDITRKAAMELLKLARQTRVFLDDENAG